MKKPILGSRSRSAFTALLFILLPFVVAFDFPDTTGVHGKISAGRGTYSMTSCSRVYQSEYVEQNAALRATFATGSDEPELAKRLQPGKTTVGAYGNWVQEELLLVREDGGAPDRPATPIKEAAQSYGAYTQFDWRNFGLQVGGAYLSQWNPDDGIHTSHLVPTAEVRLGPEYLYASAELLSSTPIQSGGGYFLAGVGGRKGGTRMWAGYSTFPVRENSLSLRLSQKVGPATLSFAGQWSPAASRYFTAHEHGVSLGLDLPLSKAW
jgi:hypothetical protein